jgi:hypothetical protein
MNIATNKQIRDLIARMCRTDLPLLRLPEETVMASPMDPLIFGAVFAVPCYPMNYRMRPVLVPVDRLWHLYDEMGLDK